MLAEKPPVTGEQLEKWESLGPLSVEKVKQAAPTYPIKLDAGIINKYQSGTGEEVHGQTPADKEEANGIVRVIAPDGTLREGQFEQGLPHGYLVEIQKNGGHRTAIYKFG